MTSTAIRNVQQTLLVVEDDAMLAETLQLEFTERGYRVLMAANHKEAMLHTAAKPNFAIIDLSLGADNGLHVLSHLINRCPRVRAIVMTGHSSVATAVEAIKIGAVHYLNKPCEVDEIEASFFRNEADPTVPIPEGVQSLARHQREYIEQVLADCDGNISEAARRLNLHRQSLQRMLRKPSPKDNNEDDD